MSKVKEIAVLDASKQVLGAISNHSLRANIHPELGHSEGVQFVKLFTISTFQIERVGSLIICSLCLIGLKQPNTRNAGRGQLRYARR